MPRLDVDAAGVVSVVEEPTLTPQHGPFTYTDTRCQTHACRFMAHVGAVGKVIAPVPLCRKPLAGL